ncbi:MAG: hypothetical protein ACKVU0_13600 [Saprospiraceae bacterium]
MKTTAYIQLPGSHPDEQALQNTLANLLENLRGLSERKAEVFYDGTSVRALLNDAEEFEDYLESSDTHLSVQEMLLNRSEKWQDKRCQMPDCRYILWDWHSGCQEMTGQTLAEMAERKLLEHDAALLFFNMTGFGASRPFLPVIKDALHKAYLPVLTQIDQVFDLADLDYWLAKNQHPAAFDLRNSERFERTNYVWGASKERIYRELRTGHHWYFDRFHQDNKVHYEVFDQDGKKHLGEADANGNLIPNTAGKDKKPIF